MYHPEEAAVFGQDSDAAEDSGNCHQSADGDQNVSDVIIAAVEKQVGEFGIEKDPEGQGHQGRSHNLQKKKNPKIGGKFKTFFAAEEEFEKFLRGR